MKKFFASLMALTMLMPLTSCGKKDDESSESSSKAEETTAAETTTAEEMTEAETTTATETADLSEAPEGSVTDETKLSEAISFSSDEEFLYIKIKTSAEFDAHNAAIDIVNPGFYLTRDSELITKCILVGGRCFDEEFDKEWFDGTYVYKIDNGMLTGIASDESERAPGTWSMLLYDEDTHFVIGQWFIVLEGSGKYHFEFKDSWLLGAGEDKETEEFDSLEDEVESWFTFKADESYDEWATFNFDGYYLEETDPQGYDKYYMMICPEGDYSTYADADAVDLTYAGIGGLEYAKCPYRFSFEQNGIENGKYTMVLAKMGGDVEVQFTAEKVSATDWKIDFSNVKCPVLESKYVENAADAEVVTAAEAETTEESAS